jgi:hypothetical protein
MEKLVEIVECAKEYPSQNAKMLELIKALHFANVAL